MSGYSEAALSRFTISQSRVVGGDIKRLVSLTSDRKVSMTLDDYYAIGCEMERLRRQVERLAGVVEDVKRAVE